MLAVIEEGTRAAMRRLIVAIVLAALPLTVLAAADRAEAGVKVRIDRASQTMAVIVDGIHRYTWPVSTGRRGYGTPTGVFHPQMLAARWFSRRYYHSPMPHAIFFHGGFAIHGSYEIARLGGPASHGCVRLHPADAAILFGLVRREGIRNTTIVVR
jgi:lipoprotein-anchoring transpeptidase ErfK/SrfK